MNFSWYGCSAVICGAYFGDKMGPLSVTANLASGLSGVSYLNIISICYTTIPAVIIALIAFFFIGMQYGNKNFDTKRIMQFLALCKIICNFTMVAGTFVCVLVTFKVNDTSHCRCYIWFFCSNFCARWNNNRSLTTLQTGYTIESVINL